MREREYGFHTARLGDVLYNIDKLRAYAENLPTRTVPISELSSMVDEGNFYWTDKNGESLGPHQILKDPQAAETNSAWAEHIQKIHQADMNDPLWIYQGVVIDGMHRLTRAILDGKQEIKVKVFDELPPEAQVPS